MSKKSALGRGLEALLPSSPGESDNPDSPAGTPLYNFGDRSRSAGRVSEVDLASLRSNPYQPRERFDETALEELAASILELGIIQPITVRAATDGTFELISGERRVRAARKAGLRTIPAYVREADTEAMLEMAIVENVQREELDPVEIALGYQRLIDECGLRQEEVAIKVGKNRSTISNFLRLLTLPATVQASLRDHKITVGHARALLALDSVQQQESLLEAIETRQLSVRNVEQRVRKLQKDPGDTSPKQESPAKPTAISHRDRLEVQSFADLLRAHYATQVHIKHQGPDGAGRIELQFYSADDLERIVEQLLKT